MRYTYRKDKRNRQIFFYNEKNLRYSAVVRKDQSLNPQYRFFILNKINLKKGLYRSRITNHCILTFRSSGMLSKFRISRIKFREMANNGYIAGIQNASW
jgi:small subunit ribosomal protein S14